MTISKRHFGYLGFFGLLGLAGVFTGNTGFYGFFGFGHAIRRTLRVAAGAGQASRERGPWRMMAFDVVVAASTKILFSRAPGHTRRAAEETACFP